MHINELSILVSAILSVAVGTIWYSPIIFGSRYVKHTHGAPSVYDSKKTIAETVVHILFAFVFFMYSRMCMRYSVIMKYH